MTFPQRKHQPRKKLPKSQQLLAYKVYKGEVVIYRDIINALRTNGLSRREAEKALNSLLRNNVQRAPYDGVYNKPDDM